MIDSYKYWFNIITLVAALSICILAPFYIISRMKITWKSRVTLCLSTMCLMIAFLIWNVRNHQQTPSITCGHALLVSLANPDNTPTVIKVLEEYASSNERRTSTLTKKLKSISDKDNSRY